MKLNHYTEHHKLTISVLSSTGGMMDFEDTGNLQTVYTGVMLVGWDFISTPNRHDPCSVCVCISF